MTDDIRQGYLRYWNIARPVFPHGYHNPKSLFLRGSIRLAADKIRLSLGTGESLIIVTGPEEIGKSSLCQYCYQILDFQNYETLLLKAPLEFDPKKWVSDHYFGQIKGEESFKNAILQIQRESRPLLVFIDEAQNLEDKQVQDIANLTKQRRLPLGFTVFGLKSMKGLWTQHTNQHRVRPLEIELNSFSLEETEAYLTYFIKNSNLDIKKLPEDFADQIFQQSGGVPGQILIAGERYLVELYLESRGKDANNPVLKIKRAAIANAENDHQVQRVSSISLDSLFYDTEDFNSGSNFGRKS